MRLVTLTFTPYFLISMCALVAMQANALSDDWNKYTSANFVIYSDVDEKQVRKTLEEFEVFRALVYRFVNLDSAAPMAPATIFMFDQGRDFRRFTKSRYTAGFYVNSPDGPLMVIGPNSTGINSLSVLYHEYIHYLVRASSPMKYPTWYDEGLAEFFSTIQLDDDFATFGGIPEHRETVLISLRPMPLEKLFALRNTHGNSGLKGDQIYASSWLVTNFLTIGKLNGFPDYSQSLRQYLQLTSQGADWQQAFSESFSVSLQELDEQVRSYARKSRLNAARLELPEIKTNIRTSALTQAEATVVLAQMAESTGNSETKTELIDQGVELNEPLALAMHSNWLASQKRFEESDSMLNQAIPYAEQEPLIWFYAGAIAKLKSDDENALKYFKLASKQSNSPKVLLALLTSLWDTGEKQAAIDVLVQLVNLMPSSITVNLVAGDYMSRVNNDEYARYFLENVLAWSHSPYHAEKAQKLLDALAD